MIGLLTKLWIKDYKNTDNPKVRQSYGVLCGIVGIVLNLLLAAGKFLAGVLSGSIAITADAFNNLSDAASSLITLAGFGLAGQNPDPEHPFGHGRIEYIAGLLVSVMILVCGVELFKSSLGRILHPEELQRSPVIIGILLGSIFVKLYMFCYNRSVGQKIKSSSMRATAIDSLSDALATFAVLAATLVSFRGVNIDGYCGVLVAVFILYAGFQAARETVSPLLGNGPTEEFVQQVTQTVLAHGEILGMHDLVVHDYGPGRVYLSLHAEVPADGELVATHNLIDGIEHELRERLHCSAVIHMDPISEKDEEAMLLREEIQGYLEELLRELSHREARTGTEHGAAQGRRGAEHGAAQGWKVSMHDFRLVRESDVTKVLFDVVTPYHFPLSDEELVKRLTEEITARHPGFRAIIDVDKENGEEKREGR